MNSWKNGLGKWFLVFSFVASIFVFQTSAYAASNSLLSGKVITPGRNPYMPLTSTTLVTDNNDATYYALRSEVASTTVTDFLIYKFDTPQNIDSFKLYIKDYTNQNFTIGFIDSSGKEENFKYTDGLTGGDNNIYQLSKPMKNVKIAYVWNHVPSAANLNVIEWDLYSNSLELTAEAGDSQIALNWEPVASAENYTVKYGTKSGLYDETVTVTKDSYSNFVIPGLTNGTTYYFVVSATVNEVESGYSNEASATPQAITQPDPGPTGDRAILTIYLTNGTEKEYDLLMTEVNAFIDWYDQKDAGVGLAKYAFTKTWNHGPFNKRTEFVIFDKILTFNVDEYSSEAE